jgi:hydrogenase-4 component E
MRSLPDLVLVLVVLTDFVVLGTSRMSGCIRAMAIQGFLLGTLPLLLQDHLSVHAMFLAGGTVLIKAAVIPEFLRRAIREATVRREVDPLVGYVGSIFAGMVALAIAFSVASVLPAQSTPTDLLVPDALATLMIGLIMLVTRGKALLQVIGYLMLENGIFIFGLTQAERAPFLVDLGVLLDVFVGVFIMGIVVFHINREFDSISSAHLTELHE